MLKGIIFDFDGLILDTETPIYQAWQEIYDQYQCELPLERLISNIGSTEIIFDPLDYLLNTTRMELSISDLNRKIDIRLASLLINQPIMPGVLDLINSAYSSKLLLAIASSSPLNWVSSHLNNLGIAEYFSCYATKDEVQTTKPSPELYLLALKKMKLNADEVIAIEDSVLGIEAAKSANLFSIAIPANLTKGLDFSLADLIVDSAAEIDLKSLASRFMN